MTDRSLKARLGARTNTSAANNASWLLAVGILAVAIPASEKIAANQVFFAAHGVSAVAWVVVLALGLGVCWLVVAGVLHVLQRWLGARAFDVLASILMLLVTWFFVGNALTRTLFADAPVLGSIVGLIVAVAITLLARTFAMGNLLVVFAAIAAAIPLLMPLVTGSQDPPATAFTFDERADRPNVVWVLSDELQYPAVFTQDGQVRPEFPHLQALVADSTVYTHGYAAANYTDYAVPAQLSGISNVAAEGTDRMQKVRAGIGIVPGMSSAYSVVMESPIYSFDCDSADCASVGAGTDVGVVQRYVDFAKDTLAIAGKTALAAPFSDFFPSLDGKWRDFWSGGDEFGDNAEGNSVQSVIDGIDQVRMANADAPVFAFWHSIRTHAPWVVDRDGVQIYPARVPIVGGAHMVGAEADQSYTTDELKRLERRLWANSAVDFDRQLGQLVDDLKAQGLYDNTMIVLTADHGATMTDHSDRRVGDDLVQRWSEVAHVPLVVKAPGQSSAEVVSEPRSTGQIAATVLSTAGASAAAAQGLSPDLSQSLAGGPVFTTVAGGEMTPWEYTGLTEVDPWQQDDLTPPDPRYPFAIGIDPAILGGNVPADWVEVAGVQVEALPGESDQQALVVERPAAGCPADVTAGIVTSDGTVVGSVLWEGRNGSADDHTRGWAIVPKAEVASYQFWCPTS